MTGQDALRISFAPGRDAAAQAAAAEQILRREGVVVLDDLGDPARYEACREELAAAYPGYARPDRTRNYGPYEGRHTMGTVIEHALADTHLLLPGPVEQIARSLLGANFMFDSVGVLMAFPGAGDQKAHADATLYPGTPLDGLLQPFALAFAQPLVEMNAQTGRTAFWLRSHRKGGAEGPWDFAPVAGPGSALLWDFRTFHAGLANTSGQLRPVLYSVLCRHWWCEYEPPEAKFYEKLRIARDVFEGMDPSWRERLRRARVVDPQPHGAVYADN